MDRKLYSDYFSACTYNLSNEVTQLYDMRQCINSSLISDYASEFSNAYLRTEYNKILQSLNEKLDNIINHQIYLGKRKSYLNEDDTDKAENLDAIMDDFEIVRTKLHQMAQDIYDSALALAAGDIGIDAIISKEELSTATAINDELGDLAYDEFMAMTETDKNDIINKAIDLAIQYVLDGTLPVPENGRIELPIAHGITIYCTVSTYTTIGNNTVAVDYNPVSHDACLHILGGDEFANTDASLSLTMEGRVTHTEALDENSSIYVASGYNINSDAFFVEKGVNVTTDSVTVNGASVNGTCTMGCGVEVSSPTNWIKQPEPVLRPVYGPYVYFFPMPTPTAVPIPTTIPMPAPVLAF
ncbi:MAG: hypothetical protein NC393_01280 [Clostridium sp.]|nr:hypothetical protein [Clostridium sp.]MCM1170735.1 hypothetical protein [Clostridium sp.]MCM1207608.1 hypothetical protein [Ruminococcus sp.]